MGETHDWSQDVDADHLRVIRASPGRFSPGGALHLVLEVVAYPVDEALHRGGGRVLVTCHGDGSWSVADDGRGTQTSYDEHGRARRKPVMATRDLRFFEVSDAPHLGDGHLRSGMSVVTALSSRLTHTTTRDGRSLTQRYEHGLPVGPLEELAGDGPTGTTVTFLPDGAVLDGSVPTLADVRSAVGDPTGVELTYVAD